jgi:hypothetical protein
MSNNKIYTGWKEFISDVKYSKYFLSKEQEWENKLEEVKKYINKYNKIPSNKSKNIEEKQLGTFCSGQRYNKRNNKLSKDRIKKLEELKYWFWEK